MELPEEPFELAVRILPKEGALVAPSADGRLFVSFAGGVMDSSIMDFIGADLVVTILETLNPFAAEDSGTASLECAVFLIEANSGVVDLDPLAIKTANLTVLGRGAVYFNTERLDFDWIIKPRKGFGISAGMITNPYVKVGGTLAKPSIDVKPLQALTSTGMAVATGGLPLLGKGLWDRLTSDRKECKKALEEADRRLAGEAPRRSTLF